MTDALQIAAALIICITAAAALVAICFIAWTQLWRWISRIVATHIDRALGTEPKNRYRDLDNEYRQLVLDEHNKGD